MATNVTLSAAVRTNLLSLQNTTSLIERTQNRLSTSLKVGSPVDDPVAFFQAKGLSDRAADFEEKKSAIKQGVSSLSSALEGVAGVEALVRQLKGLSYNAKSSTSETIGSLVTQFNDLRSQINYMTADAQYQGLNLVNGTGSTLTVDFSTVTSSVLSVASVDLTVGVQGLNVRKAVTANGSFNIAYEGNTGLTLKNSTVISIEYAGTASSLTEGSYNVTYGSQTVTFTVGTAGATTTSFTNTEAFTVGDTYTLRRASATTDIDTNRKLVTAGTFAVEFAATTNDAITGSLTVRWAGTTGTTLSAGVYSFTYGSSTAYISVGSVGATTTSFTNDRVFSSTGDAFTLTLSSAASTGPTVSGAFNWAALTGVDGTATSRNSGARVVSSTDITAVRFASFNDASAATVSAVTGQYALDSNLVGQINALITRLDDALSTLRSRSQTLGSNVALLQARLDFTTNYTTLLTQGAGKLTLADLNEEGANLLALQTRQQLGVQSLSFAGQAEQAILSLFR